MQTEEFQINNMLNNEEEKKSNNKQDENSFHINSLFLKNNCNYFTIQEMENIKE